MGIANPICANPICAPQSTLAESLDARAPALARFARSRAANPQPPAPTPNAPRARPRVGWGSALVLTTALTLTGAAMVVDVTQAAMRACPAPGTWSPPKAPPVQTRATSERSPLHRLEALAAAVTEASLEEPDLTTRAGLRTLLDQGYDALEATEFDQAMGYFTQALEVNPHSWEAHVGQGHVHLAQGRTPWALGAFETAHQLDPTHPAGLLVLARTYARMGDRASALLYYERLLKRQPDHAQARAARDQLKASLRWEMPPLSRTEGLR